MDWTCSSNVGTTNAYRMLVGECLGIRRLWILWRRREKNFKIRGTDSQPCTVAVRSKFQMEFGYCEFWRKPFLKCFKFGNGYFTLRAACNNTQCLLCLRRNEACVQIRGADGQDLDISRSLCYLTRAVSQSISSVPPAAVTYLGFHANRKAVQKNGLVTRNEFYYTDFHRTVCYLGSW